HPAAAEVANHVQRWHRAFTGPAVVRERAGQRDVVDVVAGPRRVRSLLAPARHAAEDQARVAGQARVGTDAEALHHAGTKALDEGVGALDQLHQRVAALLALEVDGDVAPVALQHVLVRAGVGPNGLGALDADDLGTHVAEHHRRERARADASD